MHENRTRNQTLDIAKGLSILFMTLSHLELFKHHQLSNELNEYLIIFKMPIFIMISGYLLSYKTDLLSFVKAKFDGLIKPILTIIFISVVATSTYYYLTDHVNSPRDIIQIWKSTLNPYLGLWFPIVLFVSLFLYRYIIDLKTKANSLKFFIYTLLIIALLLVIHKFHIQLSLFKAYAIICFMPFLFLGDLIKKKYDLSTFINPKIAVGSTIIFIVLMKFRQELSISLDIYQNLIGNYLTTSLATIAGLVMILNISNLLTKGKFISRILVQCSKSSFFILAFHIIIGNHIIFEITQYLNLSGVLVDVISFVSIISLCIYLQKFIMKTKFLKKLILPSKVIERIKSESTIQSKNNLITNIMGRN